MEESNKWDGQRKMRVLKVLEVAKANPGIKSIELVSKLGVNEPFISRNSAMQIIGDLYNDKKINISDNDEVTVCQKE